MGHIEAQCTCTDAATQSQGACYSSDVPFYDSFFTDTLMYIAGIAIACGHTMYWNEIKYDLHWYCSFCVSGVHV